MPVVRVENLRREFRSHGTTTVAVDNLDLTLERGEFICLLGPSGCGKTTTLRAIAGLETPTQGVIEISDQVVFSSESGTYVPPERRGLGMVFQSYAVWPHMTVAENVGFPLRHGIGKRDKARHGEVDDRVARMLELMDCAHLARRYPSELSGGQQQRVALARTLVYEPDLLLFDEPLSNLDAKLRERMRFELRELQQRIGFAALYVTHDREEALSLSDRILVMRDGSVAQAGTPEEIYERPIDDFVADFVGPVNLLPISDLRPTTGGVIAKTELGEVMCDTTSDQQAGAGHRAGEASVLVRPGSLKVDTHGESGPNCWQARVKDMTYLGAQVIYSLQVGEVHLIAADSAQSRTDHEWVQVTAPPEVCRIVANALPKRQAATVRDMPISEVVT